MTDDTKALVERLRYEAEHATCYESHRRYDAPLRMAADTIVALAAENGELHEALRKISTYPIYSPGLSQVVGGGCRLCGCQWNLGQPERHAPGCLAAPKDAA